jgi:hypothetical protein
MTEVPQPLADEVAQHFAPFALDELVVTRRDFPHWMRPDLQIALNNLFSGMTDVRFSGLRSRAPGAPLSFSSFARRKKAPAAAPAEYQLAELGGGEHMRCLTRGLWFGRAEGQPFAVLLEVAEGFHNPRARIEIAVPPGAEAAKCAERVAQPLAAAERGACWRGKTLVLDDAHDDFEVSPAGLRVPEIEPASREDIVLSPETLALVERNTLGFAKHAADLVELGLSSRKGVLLYGPPGTGKTLIVRWLLGALDGFTKLLVTSERYRLLSDYLAIARALQPALVVLEDVDLVGGHRDGPFAGRGATLNTLLNEMDGFAAHACVLFVLTTNRPEVIEPALAARPGRVDQAIEIGLPAEAERRILVRRHAGSLDIGDRLVEDAARRMGRVSPAFIKELMRRAAQVMLERGGTNVLELADVDKALEDMLGAGGKLGMRLLGAESAIGFNAPLEYGGDTSAVLRWPVARSPLRRYVRDVRA